jgi:hypothetical protein
MSSGKQRRCFCWDDGKEAQGGHAFARNSQGKKPPLQ